MSGLLPSGISVAANILGIIAIGVIFAIISNSAIDRIPKNQSITYPGPYCKSCAATLMWKDVIPVWSYLHSGGNCPYCGNPIGIRTLLVDAAEILWVALFIAKFGWSYDALMHMLFGMGLIAIIVIEHENRRLSDLMLLLLGMLGVISWLAFSFEGFPMAVASSLIGAAILFFYGLLTVISGAQRGMSLSETKFGAILGLFLGFPEVVLCVFLAVFLGATIGSFRIKLQKQEHQTAVPSFPILMAVSALVTILFGQEILALYERVVM